MYKNLKDLIDGLDISSIDPQRKAVLNELIAYIQFKKDERKEIQLNFICTHNSRRSHLGQIWAAAMASYYEIDNVQTFSGGTEATAVFPKIIETLASQDFEIQLVDETENPIYAVSFDDENPQYVFSKLYDDSSNPEGDFAAIMTCSQADEGCPIVAGTDKRIAITYKDPKVSDGSPDQAQIYRERSEQIATELKYVFSNIS